MVFKAQAASFRATETKLFQKRLLDCIYEPIRDAAGMVTGIFCEGFDVTETHRATQALRMREEQFRLATDAGEIGLRDVDLIANKLF